VLQGTVIADRPSSRPTIGANANTHDGVVQRDLGQGEMRLAAGSGSTTRNTIAVHGAAARNDQAGDVGADLVGGQIGPEEIADEKRAERRHRERLTAQLMNRVTPMPRQCRPTSLSAAKSILISMGMIISQISAATGRLTLAISAAPDGVKNARRQLAERHAGDDAQRDPQGEIAFEPGHSGFLCGCDAPPVFRRSRARRLP